MDNDKLARNVHLLSAIEKGDLAEVIKHLDAGAEVNFINLYRNKNTPLHDAVACGNAKIVEILLKKGASPESVNGDNKKPSQLLGFLGEKERKTIGALLAKSSTKNSPKTKNTKKQPVCESSDNPNETFTKRQGTAAAGQQYESKLLDMFLLQLLHDSQVESFYLGNNLAGIGALDDIVLKTHVRGKSCLQFVQCKHRNKGVTINFIDMIDIENTTGDLHLFKYFESYRKICSLFDPKNDNVIFRENIDKIDLELIFLTPAMIAFPKYKESEKEENRIKYIETNGLSENINTVETGKIWQVKYSKKIREIFETIHRKKLIEFLAQLLFLPEFQIDLEEAIEKLKSAKCVEIFNDLEHSDRKKYFNNIQLVKNTIKDADLKTKIDMIDERFTTESLLPSGYSKIVEDFFNKLRLYTKQATEDELKDVVESMIKSQGYDYEDVMFFKTHEAVQKWWARSGQVEYLTESCDFFEVADNECKLEKIHSISMDWLQKYYVEFRLNMLINNPKWINLHEKIKEEKFYVNIYSSTSELCCTKVIQFLQWHENEFKFIKLNNTGIDFLIEVLSKGNKEHNLILVYLPELNWELVEKIRQKVNKLIVISTNGHHGDWQSLSDTTKNILELETEFQEKLLETEVTFQGNSIPLEWLMERAPKQLIDAETIKKLVTNEKITISLDFTNSGQFYIQRDLLEYRQKQHVPRKINTIDDKVVIVTAGPGIGKSMMLTGLAAAIKSEYPSSWIVRINLLQHSTLLQKWTIQYKIAKLPKSEVLNLLMKANSCETNKGGTFEENIFKWYCEQYKLVLLVDGFDEVCPDYTTIVLQLLQSLKDNFADTLWVTTRTGTAQTILEENLEVCAHLLKPFSLEETKKFLRHFWIEIDPHHKYVQDYVDKLDSHFSQPTNQGEHKLITIPLHTSMIETSFKSDFEEYCNSNGTQTNFEKYDLFTIQDSFIDFKIKNVFMGQKNEYDTSKPQTIQQIRQLQHEHKLAAIYALFNISYATKLLSEDEIRNVKCLLHSENVLKAGIISHINEDKLIFVHQSHAETLVAKFIWEKYSACEIDNFESFVELIFIKNFVLGDRSLITHFLLIIAQSEEQNDEDKVSKACVLLDKLLSLKLCSQAEFSKRSISFLLGIVECSIPEKETEGFAKLTSIVNEKPKTRNILLLKAAENGYLKLVRLTMDDSPEDRINIAFDWLDGWTALHFAANGGHEPVVDYLLGKSAIVDAGTAENGQTALHLAAAKGHSSTVEALLGKKANINARTMDSGATPLHLAAQQGSTEVVSKLLEKGADKYATTLVDGETPLHVGCRHGHLSSVKLLIDNEQDINLRTTKNESTPLHVATENRHSAIANFLLEKGALVSVVTKDLGFTPLHFAAQNDLSETVSLLLDKDAPTDSISKSDGQTALHLAVTHRNANVVSLLLEKKANVNFQTENDGWTALHLAIRNNSYEMVEMMLQYVTDINAINVCKKYQTLLHEAVLTGNSKLVKLILGSRADTEAENINKMTPRDLASNLDNQQRQEIDAIFNEHFNKDLTYGKRPGTAAIAGLNYELKILTMVLFRLLHDEKIDDFYLGSNIEEAGSFDDVVIRTRSGDKSRVYCLQAKHKNAGHIIKFQDFVTTRVIGSAFHLSKYFQSYLKVRHFFKSESNHVIFQEEYDQTELELIIMTPALFQGHWNNSFPVHCSTFNTAGDVFQIIPSDEILEQLTSVSREWHKNRIAEILAKLILFRQYDEHNLQDALHRLKTENVLQTLINTVDCEFNCSNLLKVYNHSKIMCVVNRNFKSLREHIYKRLDESLLPSTEEHRHLVQDFFTKFKIYSEQATENELERIIRRDMLSKHYQSDELIYFKSLAAVENWWKQTGEVTFLTKKCDFFEIAKHEIELDKIHLVNMEKVNSSVSINTHDVTMNPKLVECFKEIEETLPFFINFFSTKPYITCLKILYLVQSLGIEVKIVLLDKAEVDQTLSVLSKVDKPRCLFIAVLPEPDKVAIEMLRKKVNKLVVVTKHEYSGEWKSIEDKT